MGRYSATFCRSALLLALLAPSLSFADGPWQPPPLHHAHSFPYLFMPSLINQAMQDAAIDNMNSKANDAASAAATQQIQRANNFALDAMSGKYSTGDLSGIMAARQSQADAFNQAVDTARDSGQVTPPPALPSAPPTSASVLSVDPTPSSDLATQAKSFPLAPEANPASSPSDPGGAAAANPTDATSYVLSPLAQAENQLAQLGDAIHPNQVANLDSLPKSDKGTMALGAEESSKNLGDPKKDPNKPDPVAKSAPNAADAKKAQDKGDGAKNAALDADSPSASWIPAPIEKLVSVIKNYTRGFFPEHSADVFNQRLGPSGESKAIHSTLGIRTPAMELGDPALEQLPSFFVISGFFLFSAVALWWVRRKKKRS